MANSCPDCPNAAGASVADEYVLYGAWTGGLVVSCTGSDATCGVLRAHVYPAVASIDDIASTVDGVGAVTLNVACTVSPLATLLNSAGEVAVTVQPDGVPRLSFTSSAGSAP